MPTRRTRGRGMKVKIIPIMLLILISMATPVVVSMAIPKKAEEFRVVAYMDPYLDLSIEKRGVQKYSQEGTVIDGDNTGTIVMSVSITNFYKAFDGRYARAMVHFTMTFDEERVITGIIVGKIWFENNIQYVDGTFVGKGSHVQGTISLLETDPNVLLFEGMEW